jgi:hypothetical protein
MNCSGLILPCVYAMNSEASSPESLNFSISNRLSLIWADLSPFPGIKNGALADQRRLNLAGKGWKRLGKALMGFKGG